MIRKKNKPIGLVLDESTYDELIKEADAIGLSLSAYIRVIISKRSK